MSTLNRLYQALKRNKYNQMMIGLLVFFIIVCSENNALSIVNKKGGGTHPPINRSEKNLKPRLAIGCAVGKTNSRSFAGMATDTLYEDQLPALSSGMVNVSPNRAGFSARITGNGEKVLALHYDSSKIPAGYQDFDIHTFWFDAADKNWKQLRRDSLDEERQIVYSTAIKDGEYVNAILKAPESPETQGYLPTTMKDIKIGDPAEMVHLINAPTANVHGSASLSYPIDLPPGRQGIQPELNITYDSDGGNGWLGEGWGLNISSITVDTRWGVPRFNPANETETYALDGQMLTFMDQNIPKTAHRDLGVTRASITDARHITVFRPRKEDRFQLIQRFGTDPTNYYWVVTGKNGTKSYYGGIGQLQESAVLRDEGGTKNIAEWRLVRIQDIFGNRVDYDYDKIIENNYTYLYPKLISYTQHDKDPNLSYYQVAFGYAPQPRLDQLQLNGRYGFLVNPAARKLGSMVISRVSSKDLYNLLTVRSYKFDYKTGAFGKTLLAKVTQLGDNDQPFNEHTFTYYNEDSSQPYYTKANAVSLNDRGLGGNIPGILGITNNSSTAIGGSKSSSNSVSMYVGVGSGNPASVNISGGIQYNNISSSSNGINTLVDMDGDGLPDKLYVSGGRLFYEKNLSSGSSIAFAAEPTEIQGFGNFMQESSRTTGWGASVFFGVTASFDQANSESNVNTYLADVNGDGLTDIVRGTIVFFNTGVVRNHALIFSRISSDTHAPMNGSGVLSNKFTYDNAIDKDLVKNNPLQEVVRVWEAPYDGMIDIKSTASLVAPKDPGSDLDESDGGVVTIQYLMPDNSVKTVPANLPKKNYSAHRLDVQNISVRRGQNIYFRAQSGQAEDANGAYDQIDWDPLITYSKTDQMGLDTLEANPAIPRYRFQASGDFLLSDSEPFSLPEGVKQFALSGLFDKKTTMDSVRIVIAQLRKDPNRPYRDAQGNLIKDDSGNTVFYYSFDKTLLDLPLKPGDVSADISQPVNYPDNGTDTKIQCLVKTNVNIDLQHVKWAPVLTFKQTFKTTTFDANNLPVPGKDTLIQQKKYPIPTFVFNDTLRYFGKFAVATTDTTYNLYPSLTIADNSVSGNFMFAAKTPASVLAKQSVLYKDGILVNPTPLIVKLKKGQPFVVSIESKNTDLGKMRDAAYQAVCDKILNTEYLLPAGSYKSLVVKKTNMTAPAAGYSISIPDDGDYKIAPNLSVATNPGNGAMTIEVLLNGKTVNLGQQDSTIHYTKNLFTYPLNSLSRHFGKGDQVSVQYLCADSVLVANPNLAAGFNISETAPAEFLTNRKNQNFGPMFRGWGQFIYNGMNGRAAAPIKESALVVDRTSANAVDVNAFKTNVQNAVNTGTAPARDPSLDKLSVANAVFSPMLPYAGENRRCWMGSKDSIYLNERKMSPSRLGINNVKSIDPFALAVSTETDNSYGRAVSKVTLGQTTTFSGGVGILSKNHSSGSSHQIADYLDLNGDRYPDILNENFFQVTSPTGKLSETYAAAQSIHQSGNSADGFGINGTTGRSGIQLTGFSGKNRGGGTTLVNADAGTEANQQAGGYIGASAGFNTSEENVSSSWMDMNADGLPDKVTPGGYDLNLGYNRYQHFNLAVGAINKTGSYALSPGITAGFSFDDNSFSGGAGLSFSDGLNKVILQDMNGDGIPDRVTITPAGDVMVEFNTGNNFLPNVNCLSVARGGNNFNSLGIAASFPVGFLPSALGQDWFGFERQKFSSSNSVSLGGSVTFGFSLLFVKIVIRPSFNHSEGMGRTIRQMVDINGDGLPDFVYSTKENNMEVWISDMGKSNKLEKVENPLHGVFTIDYDHTDNTQDHPGGKWVMSSLEVNDGIKADRSDPNALWDSKKIFKYTAGKYDEYERDFLGFANITTDDLDFTGKPSRTTAETFDTGDYYSAGHLLEQTTRDPANLNAPFTFTRNTYDRIPIAGRPYTIGAFHTELGVIYSPLKNTVTGTYEGGAAQVLNNKSTYQYDRRLGLLTRFTYKENPATESDDSFDYQTLVTYDPMDPDNYIFGQPTDVLTKNQAGNKIYRHVSSTYYGWTNRIGGINVANKRRLWTFSNAIDNGVTAVSSYTYDNVTGNMVGKTMPSGISFKYVYDADISVTTPYSSNNKTFITDVIDLTHQFASKTLYDYRYGIPWQIKDINNNYLGYELDHFGRIVRIVGPNECNTPISAADCLPSVYTIKVDYSLKGTLTGNGLIARVSHYDDNFPEGLGIQTLNFIDGFKRSVQVKRTAALMNASGVGDNNTNWIVSGRVFYDALGREEKQYYPVKEAGDGLTFLATPDAVNPTVKQYDVLDRVTKKNYPDGPGLATSYIVEGKRSAEVTTYFNAAADGSNQKREIVKNGNGLKEKEITFLNDGTSIVTAYGYDGFHQLNSITDSKGNLITYDYNQAGNLKLSINPDAGTTTNIYDNAGHLSERVTAAGEHIRYGYKNDYLTSITYPKHPENSSKNVYGVSSPDCVNCRGRLIYQEDASGSQSFHYGLLGEKTQTTRTIIAPFSSKVFTFIMNYRYDSWNRIRSVTYPDAEVVEYDYNRAGLLDHVTGNRNNVALKPKFDYVEQAGYDEFDQTVYFRTGDKTVKSYIFEPARRRLSTLSAIIPDAASEFTGFKSEYSYDNLDNITVNNVTRTKNGSTFKLAKTYIYDEVNRLASSTGKWDQDNETATYDLNTGYDPLFNVTSKNLILNAKNGAANIASLTYADQFSYAKTPHQLSGLTETISRNNDPAYFENNQELYGYDQNGNDTLKAVADKAGYTKTTERKILWDEEKRISAISVNGYVSHYIYDAAGERVVKLSEESEGVFINGKFASNKAVPATFVLYANPYYSMRNGEGVYTKNIYIGNRLLLSQLENEQSFGEKKQFPSLQNLAVLCPAIDQGNRVLLADRRTAVNNRINADYDNLLLKHQKIASNSFDGKQIAIYDLAVDPFKPETTTEPLPKPNGPQLLSYYYHTNQTGSTVFITNDQGGVVQYLEYLPFGETFIEHRKNYDSQCKFNGKQEDQETGLYYYGSRYYDNHSYHWLSTDPKATDHSVLGPYNFNLNNPMKFVDPDGQEPQSIGERELDYQLTQIFSDPKNDRKGIQWAGAAQNVSHAMDALANSGPVANFFADILKMSSPEARSLANQGNKVIYDDAMPKLRAVLSGPRLTGLAALRWDANQLWDEQMLVQTVYDNASPEAFKILDQGAKQTNPVMPLINLYFGIKLSPFPEKGNLKDVLQRWEYGMGQMYQGSYKPDGLIPPWYLPTKETVQPASSQSTVVP